jgi:hypothetical protein
MRVGSHVDPCVYSATTFAPSLQIPTTLFVFQLTSQGGKSRGAAENEGVVDMLSRAVMPWIVVSETVRWSWAHLHNACVVDPGTASKAPASDPNREM